MANIFDYLTWRADVPLTVDPFNEVDNLILSELAYTDFSGIVSESGPPVAVDEVCERFFQKHKRDDIVNDSSFTAKAPLLMEKMLGNARFGDMKICSFLNKMDAASTVQASAVSFLLSDDTVFVAFRGTDSSIIGWKEDFDIGVLSETGGQEISVQYLEKIAETFDRPIRVGGHSKGGNFAVYAASFCDYCVQGRLLSVYTNDGPGFRREITESEGYLRILPKIVRIVPDTSMIGLLLSNKSEPRVIKSSGFGLLQHDGFTWQVVRNRFESTELSELGRISDQILDSWIDGMDDETRRSVTDTIFSLFESTGADTFHEMSQQKLKAAEAMFSSLRSIPKEKQMELLRLAGNLIKNGGQVAWNQLPEVLSKKIEGNRVQREDI